MKSDPTIKIITLGFGSLLILMSIVVFVVLTQINSTVDYTSQLVNITHAKANHAHAMREYIRLRGQAITEMYLTEDFFEREQLRVDRYELAKKYKEEYDGFMEKGVTEEEQAFFDRIQPLLVSAREINDETTELMLEDVGPQREREQMIIAIKARTPLLKELNQLVSLQNQKERQVLEETKSHIEKTKIAVTVIPLTAILIGLIIAYLVIKESKKKTQEIRYRASHDALTELVNRHEFERQLKLTLKETRENNNRHVLCFLDLDQFKIINDTCGHKAGDELLKRLTVVIHENVRKQDTLGRIGGDEFGLLLKECPVQKAIEITENLVELVRKEKFEWEGRTFTVGVSIGLVEINAKTESITKAMSQADVACYAAKDMGRNQIHVYEMHGYQIEKIHKELSWVADIGQSLSENRFLLYAQPIIPVADESQQIMFEILLRMKDDHGTVVSPQVFIPAAERYNLMHDVDYWVIDKTFTYLSEHFSEINKNVKLFINLSANSLSNEDIKKLIRKRIRSLNVAPDSICFEITETTAIRNIESSLEFMKELHKMNCQFALDDFGSGMSSFSYLKNLPVDYLKIEGSFVSNIVENKIDQALVSAFHQIGRTMHIKTIAEHVENKEILGNLRKIGVNYAQGYYIQKPQPIEDVISSLPLITNIVKDKNASK